MPDTKGEILYLVLYDRERHRDQLKGYQAPERENREPQPQKYMFSVWI